MNRLSDPAWKSGPSEQRQTDSEHAIHPEDFGSSGDIDGFGRQEAKRVDGEPLVAVRERVECSRDGCDASHSRSLLFTTATLEDDEVEELETAADPDSIAAYVSRNAKRVDPETIRVETVDIDLYITVETIIHDEPYGPCYGHTQPDPEPNWRKF